ncbi:MAG: methyltransferase domain-containing protein [Planctomycetota bacterium]
MDKQAETVRSGPQYDTVKEYYGRVLQKTSDLKTDACCTSEATPAHIRAVLPLISDEVKAKYYGCGSPIPLCIEGLKILDLGCGTGRDCYIMSKLAGPNGFVSGIDMTENQIAGSPDHRLRLRQTKRQIHLRLHRKHRRALCRAVARHRHIELRY